jgi:hypothetical protein
MGKMSEQEEVELLLQRMVGQVIEGVAIDNDEFVVYLEDGTKIVLYSDEDLNLYYELPEATH